MGKYRIEILGSGEKDVINLEGCKLIEKYEENEIAILLFDRKFTVKGKCLTMPVLFKENLCIKGYVKSIAFTPSNSESNHKQTEGK